MSDDTDLTVWTAGPDDVDEVMELSLMACAENGITNPNPLKLLQDVWPALNREMGVMGAVGKKGGKIEGVILLRIENMWYSDDVVLDERAIFIHPEFRSAKGGRARMLAEFAKRISDELDLPLVIGVLSTQRTEAKVRMYQRVFGQPAGAYWIYNGKTGQDAHAET